MLSGRSAAAQRGELSKYQPFPGVGSAAAQQSPEQNLLKTKYLPEESHDFSQTIVLVDSPGSVIVRLRAALDLGRTGGEVWEASTYNHQIRCGGSFAERPELAGFHGGGGS